MLRTQRAQSTLEYIIIFTAVVAVILLAAKGVIKDKMTNIMGHVAEQAETAVKHVDFK